MPDAFWKSRILSKAIATRLVACLPSRKQATLSLYEPESKAGSRGGAFWTCEWGVAGSDVQLAGTGVGTDSLNALMAAVADASAALEADERDWRCLFDGESPKWPLYDAGIWLPSILSAEELNRVRGVVGEYVREILKEKGLGDEELRRLIREHREGNLPES